MPLLSALAVRLAPRGSAQGRAWSEDSGVFLWAGLLAHDQGVLP